MSNKRNLIFILFAIPVTVFAHDIRMGIFEISEEDERFELKMTLDSEDLTEAVKKLNPYLARSDRKEFEACLIEYIEQNFSMSLNKETITLTNLKFEYSKNVISVLADVETTQCSVKSFGLQNTILLNEVDRHSNIIQLNLNAQVRSFRIDKDRPEIIVEYQVATNNI